MAIPMKSKKSKTVLVTGANGLLGQKLIEQLKGKEEYRLLASGLGGCRLPEHWKGFDWVSMDVTDLYRVKEVFEEYKPDVVIHTAAMTQVDDCENQREEAVRQNVDAVRNLVEVCGFYNTHLIHLSTDFIFDGQAGPYEEDTEPNPVNFYGETKLEAEKLIMASSIPWSIVRTVLVYGIAQDLSRSNIILWVKNSLEAGKTIQVVNDQWRTPTLAEDLAQGCILVMEKEALGVFNISGKDFLTPYDMALMTAEFFRLDKNLIKEVNSRVFTQPARRPLRTGFVLDKAFKELDYRPKSFMEGIGILAKQLNLPIH